MASITFIPLLQTQLFPFALCKYPSSLHTCKFYYSSHILTFSPTKHTLQLRLPPLLQDRAHALLHLEANLSTTDQQLSKNTLNQRNTDEIGSGFSSFSPRDKRVGQKYVKNNVSSVEEDNVEKSVVKDRGVRHRLDSKRRKEMGPGFSSMRSKDENLVKRNLRTRDYIRGEKMHKITKKSDSNQLGMEKMNKGSKKKMADSPGAMLRVGLDMCSKRGDVMGAIRLYELARREGIKIGQYHYAVLLYLCSSAATGVVQPAKSGSGSRSLSGVDLVNEVSYVGSDALSEFKKMGKRNFDRSEPNKQVSINGMFVKLDKIHGNSDKKELNINSFPVEGAGDDLDESFNGKEKSTQFSSRSMKHPQTLDGLIHLMKCEDDSSNVKAGSCDQEDSGIHVTEDIKIYALQRGFEIYEEMLLAKVPMNEATLTSVARMALSMGNGDMAFDMVKQMKALGINPRLRSYGPALSAFCSNGDVEKAFIVEEHMLEHGVYPEEPELEALLRASIEAGRSDKVYYLLHKLRTSVRQISRSTADLIEKWFQSKVASRVGKRKWDKKLITEAIENRGGGWHGQGWLGTGKWMVNRTSVGADALCKCCGVKLATIDLDPTETENFAESVASIAAQREKNSSFQKFQRWLDYYGPFEAVIDGANVGLFSQRRFKPSKVNAIVNGIRQMLPSKKWPLIILHNRRITGEKMDGAVNKALIEKWKNADALYATPTGSNDDWYWLYAAIKFKCLIVTNDEMRDHLFQLLGNDFFPKWKERHQVHFSFSNTGPVIHMPPPCSIVIQESEKGHWHIPIASEHDLEGERIWLCITRANSCLARKDSATIHEESQFAHSKKGHASSDAQIEPQVKLTPLKHGNRENSRQPPQEIYRNLKRILSSSMLANPCAILPEIEAAEKLGGCVIDFQI